MDWSSTCSDPATVRRVGERQRASALHLGAKYAAAEGFQYIVTLNSDETPKELLDGRVVEDFVRCGG
ncbi:DUF2326 domain-containing protein [Kibdelosporangium persicum]|uniref:DUF2326 domain-containing protein n=1 Tax=Kibdelosporangium persicum TaxID=2698649 RepID=UPI001563CD7E